MNNSNLYCTVHYTYSVDNLPLWVKGIVEREFMRVRNDAVKLLNGNYEKWNDEYADVVEGEFDERYNAFIRKKQDAILSEYNRTSLSPVKLFSGEDCDIAGRFAVDGKSVEMHMGIELLNLDEFMKS